MIDLKLVHEYTKGLHVLYVEDNETLRESTLKVLNNFFKQVDSAIDGLDGVDKYKTFQKNSESPYDLVISDINMPHMNGVEMSAEILKIEPTQSIVFITAHNEAEYLHQAISLGISSFLLKPLNLQDLASVLYKVCQSITDRKLVEEHYRMMEDINQQLENQNQALEDKNREQEKLIRLLETMDMKVKQAKNAAPTEVVEKSDTYVHEKASSYYEQMEQLIREDLSELQELQEELDTAIIAVIYAKDTLKRNEMILEVPARFSRYASILSLYPSFESLTLAMQNLTKAMQTHTTPIDESKTEEIFMFLESFMYILGKWQKDLLAQDDKKVDQLDVSIVGDLETITNMWLAEEERTQNCKVEFF